MTEELPVGWRPTTLGEVVDRPRPKSAPKDHPDLPFVGMDSIAPGSMSLLSVGRFGDMKSAGGIFESGDVLYGRMRPYLNKVHRARQRGACSAEFIVMPPSAGIDGDFLAYLLHQREFVNFASEQSSGDRPRVDFESLSSFSFGLPPKPEQQRIVSRIEKLFSEIDEGERALERVGRLVERYRQSVLKAAVTGELTREWRNRNAPSSASAVLSQFDAVRAKSGRREAPVPAAEVEGLPELPSGWAWASLDAVADVVGGITVDRKRSAEGCDEVPYLRVANVQRGYLDLTEVKTIVAPRGRIEQLRLQPGDVLFNEGGDIDKLGRGWLWQGELPLCIHQNHVFRARLYATGPWNKVISWFGNVLGKRLFMDMGKQTTNLASLSLSKLKSVPIPIMSWEEAAEMVSRVEDALSVIDRCIEDLAVQQRGSASLRQAVLKAAFAGQLVPQDPRDEPASALLARLAAQASDAPATPRRRGRPASRRLSQPNPEVAE